MQYRDFKAALNCQSLNDLEGQNDSGKRASVQSVDMFSSVMPQDSAIQFLATLVVPQ